MSGFRKGYSCQTTLLRMIQDWKTAFDNGNFVGSIAVVTLMPGLLHLRIPSHPRQTVAKDHTDPMPSDIK